MNTEEIRQKLARRASRAIVGGFRPSDDPRASWFGRVLMGKPNEAWPEQNGAPLMPLCQLNLTEAPYRPPILSDVAFLTVFIVADPYTLPSPVAENGAGWLLRAYATVDDLTPLPQPADTTAWFDRPFPIRWEDIPEDFPCHEDAYTALGEVVDGYYNAFRNQDGTKIGGWPSLLQSEIFWTDINETEKINNVTFALQIDTEPKAYWQWVDQGVGYIGRGTSDRSDHWFLDIQFL